jgi:hypothetical protein
MYTFRPKVIGRFLHLKMTPLTRVDIKNYKKLYGGKNLTSHTALHRRFVELPHIGLYGNAKYLVASLYSSYR